MPKLDGIATLSALRAIAPFLQVIIVSGKATPEDAVQARALGAFDFVPEADRLRLPDQPRRGRAARRFRRDL